MVGDMMHKNIITKYSVRIHESQASSQLLPARAYMETSLFAAPFRDARIFKYLMCNQNLKKKSIVFLLNSLYLKICVDCTVHRPAAELLEV